MSKSQERLVSAEGIYEAKAQQIQTGESYHAERVVQIARATVGVLGIIIILFTRQSVSPRAVTATLIASGVLILHSLISTLIFASPKFRNTRIPRITQYISSAFDMITVSLALWGFGQPDTFKSSVFQLYFPFVALASFRYSGSLTLFTGLLGVVAYLSMFFISLSQGTVNLGTVTDEYNGPYTSVVSIVNKAVLLFLVSFILSRTAKGYSRLMLRVMSFARTSEKQKQRTEDMRGVLKRYFSEEVAEHILKNRQTLLNERKEVTVMFCDFRNFTALTHQLPTENVVEILNAYLSEMVSLVFKYNGTLDKYAGDGFMALFGAPLSKGNDPYNALCVAKEIERCVEKLNKQYQKIIPVGLEMGIGISTGEVVVGNIGSVQRTEYTVIGETANLASRLEKLNKTLQTRVLFSEATYKKTEELVQVKDHGHLGIRGIKEPVHIFELLEVPEIQNA